MGTADIVMVVVVGMVFDCWVSVLETFVNDGRGSRWWFLGCISGVGPMVLSLVVDNFGSRIDERGLNRKSRRVFKIHDHEAQYGGGGSRFLGS